MNPTLKSNFKFSIKFLWAFPFFQGKAFNETQPQTSNYQSRLFRTKPVIYSSNESKAFFTNLPFYQVRWGKRVQGLFFFPFSPQVIFHFHFRQFSLSRNVTSFTNFPFQCQWKIPFWHKFYGNITGWGGEKKPSGERVEEDERKSD